MNEGLEAERAGFVRPMGNLQRNVQCKHFNTVP
jgi:hypothetical protein